MITVNKYIKLELTVVPTESALLHSLATSLPRSLTHSLGKLLTTFKSRIRPY